MVPKWSDNSFIFKQRRAIHNSQDVKVTASLIVVSKNSKEEESQTIRILEESEIEELLKSTPTHVTEGKGFLKQLGTRAIISYSDYVFLVSLLK